MTHGQGVADPQRSPHHQHLVTHPGLVGVAQTGFVSAGRGRGLQLQQSHIRRRLAGQHPGGDLLAGIEQHTHRFGGLHHMGRRHDLAISGNQHS